MSKKKTTKVRTVYTSRWSGVDLLAFLALAAAALLLIVGPLLGWLLSGTIGSLILRILNLVAHYCLLIAIAIPAWYYVRNKSTGWRVAYFVFLIIYVAATVLGIVIKI